jgi:hypothetical protein
LRNGTRPPTVYFAIGTERSTVRPHARTAHGARQTQLAENLLTTLRMKTPHIVATVVVALLLAVVGLSVGTFFLLPVILLMISAALVAGLIALPLLIVAAVRTSVTSEIGMRPTIPSGAALRHSH